MVQRRPGRCKFMPRQTAPWGSPPPHPRRECPAQAQSPEKKVAYPLQLAQAREMPLRAEGRLIINQDRDLVLPRGPPGCGLRLSPGANGRIAPLPGETICPMISDKLRNILVGLTMCVALAVLMYGIMLLGKTPSWSALTPYSVTLIAPNANGVTGGTKVDLNGVNIGQVG